VDGSEPQLSPHPADMARRNVTSERFIISPGQTAAYSVEYARPSARCHRSSMFYPSNWC